MECADHDTLVVDVPQDGAAGVGNGAGNGGGKGVVGRHWPRGALGKMASSHSKVSSTADVAVAVGIAVGLPAVVLARVGAQGAGRLKPARAASAVGPTEVPPGERGEAGEMVADWSLLTGRCSPALLGGKANTGKVGGVGGDDDERVPLKGALAEGSFGAAARRASSGVPAGIAHRGLKNTSRLVSQGVH